MPWRAQFSGSSLQAFQAAVLWRADGRRRCACGVRRKRSSFDGHAFPWSSNCSVLTVRTCGFPSLFCNWLLGLGAGIVVCELHTYFPSVFSFTVESVPVVALSAARCDDSVQTSPRLSNQFRLFIVIEDGYLQAMVVGRVAYCKAQFLVPSVQSQYTPQDDIHHRTLVLTISASVRRACPSLFSSPLFLTERHSTDLVFPLLFCLGGFALYP